jgi:hypothetical protein
MSVLVAARAVEQGDLRRTAGSRRFLATQAQVYFKFYYGTP